MCRCVCVSVWLNTERFTVCWESLKEKWREEKEDNLMRIVVVGCRKFVTDVCGKDCLDVCVCVCERVRERDKERERECLLTLKWTKTTSVASRRPRSPTTLPY